MKNYEMLYIVSNQFTEHELEDIRKHVNGLIEKFGGVVGYQDLIGKKKLSYPINKAIHGYYVVTEFELEDGSKIDALTNELKLDKQVLRAQIISKPKITEAEIKRYKARLQKEAEAESAPEGQDRKPRRSIATKESPSKPKVDPAKMKKLDDKLDEILKDDNVAV